MVSHGQNEANNAADNAKMFKNYFHSVFATKKKDIALPAISAKSDNMLGNIFVSKIDVVMCTEGVGC